MIIVTVFGALFDAGFTDQLLGDTTHLSVDGLAGNDAFDWYRNALPFSASHDQLLGDTAHIGVDRLVGNDAFHWILDYGNDVATLNNDNYVDKIVGTNSNNSSALLAQNKQIDDTVLGAGAGDSAVPLGFGAYSNCFWCW